MGTEIKAPEGSALSAILNRNPGLADYINRQNEHTGFLNPGEAFRPQHTDVELDGRTVRVVRAKGSDEISALTVNSGHQAFLGDVDADGDLDEVISIYFGGSNGNQYSFLASLNPEHGDEGILRVEQKPGENETQEFL